MSFPTVAMCAVGASFTVSLPLSGAWARARARESAATISRLKCSGAVTQGAQYVLAPDGVALNQGGRFIIFFGFPFPC
jgi:hypothetical protein